MDDSEQSPEELVTFDLTLDVDEDIDSYLQRFVFLSKLGYLRLAKELAESILWQYIDCFEVFAELTAFYISIQHDIALSDLLLDLTASKTIFTDHQQQNFTRAASLYVRDRINLSTINALSRKVTELDHLHQLDKDDYWLFATPDFSSAAQLYNIEIRIGCALAATLTLPAQAKHLVADFAAKHLNALLKRNMHEEAVGMFSAICENYSPFHTSYIVNLLKTYRILRQAIQGHREQTFRERYNFLRLNAIINQAMMSAMNHGYTTFERPLPDFQAELKLQKKIAKAMQLVPDYPKPELVVRHRERDTAANTYQTEQSRYSTQPSHRVTKTSAETNRRYGGEFYDTSEPDTKHQVFGSRAKARYHREPRELREPRESAE